MASMNQSTSMTVHRAPGPDEIASFLTSRTTAQMARLVQAIREPAAAAALTRSLLQAAPGNSGRTETRAKAKKALNAFVGFRCYYLDIPAFKSHAMKKLSRPMSNIWNADPNMTLWILLTKAWSKIRDQIGKDDAPLNDYLAIVCPYLQIPSPESYLDCLGWEFGYVDGNPSVRRVSNPPPKSVGTGVAATGLSVEDIISYCKSTGFAEPYVLDMNITSPTFLGQSLNTPVGMNPPDKTTIATEVHVHNKRVAAKNQRRAKRQDMRDIGRAPELQEEIAYAHATGGADLPLDETFVQGVDAHHRELSEALFNTMIDSYNNTILPNDFNFNQPLNNMPVDWSAFRVGADESATLPPFDPSNGY
ncbi:MAT1-1-1 mating-type protein [Corynespora cassiicola Philippines]|uniref:Mating-type protein MAT-1 n=1 Tax=Corynespora cassiicola Philippines TaxID=1448308 RepID=A0A2T2NXB6_CORCC|nr:MAT1-1-1 mating-type protein [Corynespora cassiicola Philippines]